MATYKRWLQDNRGDTVIPKTLAEAVQMEDGTTLEFANKNVPTSSVKITEDVAAALGLVEGTTLSQVLIDRYNTSNVLVSAEVIN